MLWSLVITLLRISALLNLLTNFGISRQCRFLCFPSIWLCLLNYLAILLPMFFICKPLVAAWDPNAQGQCGNETIAYVNLEIVGIVIDLVILVLPIPMIFRLTMPLREKWIAFSFFSFAAL